MISVIISTHNQEYYAKVSTNIEKTIGQTFEIIAVRNSGQYSIAQAYNIGAKKARYPYLCFVHEDVLFETNNWGKELIRTMINERGIGLIGIAGSKIITNYSLGWCCPFLPEIFLRGHLKQGLNSLEKYKYENFSSDTKDIDDVVALDGVFLFVKREIWEKNNFDEKIIKGFHGYDLDFSLQVFFNGFRVVIDKNIMLYHYSLGNANKDWFCTNQLILRKWKKLLPAKANDLLIKRRALLKVNILLFLRYLKHAFKYRN